MTVHRSPFPDVPIPDVSLPDFVLDRLRSRGDGLALIDGLTGRELTAAELVRRVDALASGLAARGLGKGSVVGLAIPNSFEFAVALLGGLRAGATVTPINPSLTAAEQRKQLLDSGAVELLTAERVAELEVEAEPPAVAVDPARDVAVLPYSSGTSGSPKGVMLTHRNLVAMQVLLEPLSGTGPDDVVVAVLPFFHIYGLSVILLEALCRGARLVVFPRFEMESFLAAAERHRATRLPLVPPLVIRLAGEPRLDAFDLSSVRVVISGAAPLAPGPAARLSERLGGALVKHGYGMTELSPGGHMQPEDGTRPEPGTVGVLHPNTEMRLVDPQTGEDAPAGATGEIWYRGPQVMKGYLGRPEATAEAITPDGWLRTGDIGRVDGGGRLLVVDRIKELVKYKGFQVAPAELEALLLTHPAIADAAVVPKPDPEAGEIPKAYVVAAAGAALTAGEVIAFVAERVAGYKRVREVEFVDEIPKSPAGKILRRILVARERERAGQGEQVVRPGRIGG